MVSFKKKGHLQAFATYLIVVVAIFKFRSNY